MLKAERLYEELLGQDRQALELEINKFEGAMATQDKDVIDKARERLEKALDTFN